MFQGRDEKGFREQTKKYHREQIKSVSGTRLKKKCQGDNKMCFWAKIKVFQGGYNSVSGRRNKVLQA